MPTFRISLLLIPLLAAFPLLAQPARESSPFWATKGQSLMRAGQYAEAYSAFQLAKSLGAEGMTTQMELAKKRNLNSIQLRALMAESRLLATTDPTQSLRLLEYAHQKFPDSTNLLKIMGEVANQPDTWYYSLRADSIRASPRFTYLLADTDKARLYLRQGEALILVHTFAERPGLRAFSPNDDYLFVTTGNSQKGVLYALQGQKMTLVRSFDTGVLTATFSPSQKPDYGSWLLLDVFPDLTFLVDLKHDQPLFKVSPIRKPSPSGQHSKVVNSCQFSPGGRYLTTPDRVWQLGLYGIKPVVGISRGNGENAIAYISGWFSDDERHFLAVQRVASTGTTMRYTLRHYTFSERGDSACATREWGKWFVQNQTNWELFSPGGRYLAANDSLFYYDGTTWQSVRPVVDREAPSTEVYPEKEPRYLMVRFSPDSLHVLIRDTESGDKPAIRLWRLNGAERKLVFRFPDKTGFQNDVFSADGRFLLTYDEDDDGGHLWEINPYNITEFAQFREPFRKPELRYMEDTPMSQAHFSPDGRHLITYSTTANAADSLWQITYKNDAYSLKPVRGFETRLVEAQTRFSPDGQWLLVAGSGTQPAMVWNLNAQEFGLRVPVRPGTAEAVFSPNGNRLITNESAGGVIWNVSNRRLTPIEGFSGFGQLSTLDKMRFSADGRYVMQAEPNVQQMRDYSGWLYRVNDTTGATILREYTAGVFWYSLLSGMRKPQLTTYQPGLFSPDGSRWLQTQSLKNVHIDKADLSLNADTLWNLTTNPPSFAFSPVQNINRYTVWAETDETTMSWHSVPAALFARDGRFLLTNEQNRLRFYGMQTGIQQSWTAPQPGYPLDVSANGDYWLTAPTPEEPTDDPRSFFSTYDRQNTPDSVQLWRRDGSRLVPLVQLKNLYNGLNLFWQGNRRQSLFSPVGNYLLLPTAPPKRPIARSIIEWQKIAELKTASFGGGRFGGSVGEELAETTLFALSGNSLRPVVQLKTQLLNAALISPNPASPQTVALLYTDLSKQTYLLRYGPGGTQTTALGFGQLEHPPRVLGRFVWWTRKIDTSKQSVELLDVMTGQTLVKVPFGAVFDYALRPDGNVWVASPAGARLIRAPNEVVNWLKTAPIAPLNPELKGVFVFL